MQEVLNKIDELVSLLENKNNKAEALSKKLAEDRKQLEKLNEKAVAKLNHVSAMERVYKKYEDFDKSVKEFNQSKKDYDAQNVSINKRLQEVDEKESKLKELAKELKDKEANISRKVIALKEREANFDKKKDDLKAMISGQAIKDILK